MRILEPLAVINSCALFKVSANSSAGFVSQFSANCMALSEVVCLSAVAGSVDFWFEGSELQPISTNKIRKESYRIVISLHYQMYTDNYAIPFLPDLIGADWLQKQYC